MTKRQNPAKQKTTNHEKVVYVQNQLHLPKEDAIVAMEKHCEGSIDRFLKLLEDQRTDDATIDKQIVKNQEHKIINERIWIIFNGIIALVALAAIAYLIIIDKPVAALIAFGTVAGYALAQKKLNQDNKED